MIAKRGMLDAVTGFGDGVYRAFAAMRPSRELPVLPKGVLRPVPKKLKTKPVIKNAWGIQHEPV
jgi:hypothetical protein